MNNCFGCNYYDDSVDCCNCDDYCYMDGIDKGIEIAAEKLENAFECDVCPAKKYCGWGVPCKNTFIKFLENSEEYKNGI